MKEKGSAPILLLVGILIIGVIASGAYYFIKTQTTIPQPSNSSTTSQIPQKVTSQTTPVPDEAANWQNLIVNDCHLSLSYPREWEGKMIEDGGCAFKIKNPNAKVSYFLLNTLATNVSWDDIVNKHKDGKDTLIAGKEGLIAKPMIDQTGGFYGIYFHSQNLIYSITYFITSDDVDTEDTYNKITSSIKFLDQNDETANPDLIGADWKTYTNTKYEFSVQYPKGRSLGPEPQAPDSELLSSRSIYKPGDNLFQNGTIAFTIREFGSGSIEHWENLAESKATEIVVGGEKGKKVLWIDNNRSDGIKLYTQVIVIDKNELNFIINGFIDDNSSQKETFLKEFNQILSTFKFN